MARIDGLIILDSNSKPLITSHFALHPPSYPSIHIDTYTTLSKLVRADGQPLDPVVYVSAVDRSGGAAGAGLCHVQREGLTFLVPISQEVNPLFAFAFLDAFLQTLQEYLGDITEASIKDNFDIVYMLIEEMLDEGHPMTMEPALLKEIVLPPTLVRKLLNVAGVSALQTPTTSPFTAPIPWRRQNVRHANNEIYFDVVESMDAIVDRRGKVLSSTVWGRINCNSRLSGNPDLLLALGNPKAMTNCSFHPCIRYGKWERDHVLSFVPPDGKFKLLEYEAIVPKREMPVVLTPQMVVENTGGRFSLTLRSRTNHRPIEDIVVSVYLGAGAGSVSATAVGDRRMHAGGPGARGPGDAADGGAGGGVWEFDPNTQALKWTVSSLTATERAPTLTGSWVTSDPSSVPSPSFSLAFSIPNHSFSALKIDQLKVRGDVAYKPFKGVRMAARGPRCEVRW